MVMKQKSLSDLPESLKPYFKWLEKIEILKAQVDFLEETTKHEATMVSVFLLKSQLIEFELKQLISELDLKINEELNKKDYKRKIRTPRDLSSDYNCTLGKLITILCEFEGERLDKLKNMLLKLKTPRNSFTHKLFDPDISIDDINKNMGVYIRLANEILVEIENIFMDIRKKNSSYNTNQ